MQHHEISRLLHHGIVSVLEMIFAGDGQLRQTEFMARVGDGGCRAICNCCLDRLGRIEVFLDDFGRFLTAIVIPFQNLMASKTARSATRSIYVSTPNVQRFSEPMTPQDNDQYHQDQEQK